MEFFSLKLMQMIFERKNLVHENILIKKRFEGYEILITGYQLNHHRVIGGATNPTSGIWGKSPGALQVLAVTAPQRT